MTMIMTTTPENSSIPNDHATISNNNTTPSSSHHVRDGKSKLIRTATPKKEKERKKTTRK
jgi:hypothetical protein